MKRLILSLALALFALNAFAEGKLTEHVFRHKGVDYTYYLYLPENLKADAPLVMVFHGYGSRNIPSIKYGMNDVADRHGFAVCYPKGPKDFKGKNCWSVGYSFHIEKGWSRDDVGFTERLVRHLQKSYKLSRENVFATGHSNGGEMSYLLAMKSKMFAAVAPISGLMMEWMYRDLTPKRIVPLLEIHGTLDKTSAWNGDPTNKGGWGEYIAVPRAVGYWAALNRCTHEETEELPLRRNKVIAHRYVNGTNGREVWLYEVVGGKHSWAEKDLDTSAEIWRFFSKYLK